MKKYDYIPAYLITNYPGWNIEGILPARNKQEEDYAIGYDAWDKIYDLIKADLVEKVR